MSYAYHRKDFSRERIGSDREKTRRKIVRSIRKIAPDHAEITVGGPAPLPRAKVEWNKERRRIWARMNA
jgi:hypothetical protein